MVVFQLVPMSRVNKTEPAVVYYILGLVLLGSVRVIALSIRSNEPAVFYYT